MKGPQEMDVFLTVEEVAKLLRLDPATIQRETKAGRLPARKVGRAYRFHKGELYAHLKVTR